MSSYSSGNLSGEDPLWQQHSPEYLLWLRLCPKSRRSSSGWRLLSSNPVNWEYPAARPHGCRAPPIWRGRTGSVHGALMGHPPFTYCRCCFDSRAGAQAGGTRGHGHAPMMRLLAGATGCIFIFLFFKLCFGLEQKLALIVQSVVLTPAKDLKLLLFLT